MSFVPLSVDDNPGPAPSGWSWRRLTELARLESGHTPSRRHPEWWGGDIPWLALPDIRALDGKVALATGEYTNSDGILNSSARVLPAGTVALSRTASVGYVTILGRPMSTSQDFVNWVCGPDLDPEFLAFLFRASRQRIHSLASGAVHKTVYVPTVEAFHVCIPTFGEQKRIAALLKEQMAAVGRARAAAEGRLATAQALPDAFLRSYFLSPKIRSAPTRRLRDLAPNDDAFIDGPFGSNLKTEHYTVSGARVIRLQNIGQGQFLDKAKAFISMDRLRLLQRHCVRPGDIVVAALGDGARPAGRSCMVPSDVGPALVKADCFRVRLPEDKILGSYLVAFLNSPTFLRMVAEIMRGATRPRMTLGMLREVEIPLPDVDEQHRFAVTIAERMAVARGIIVAAEEGLMLSKSLSDTVLRRAFCP